MAVMITGDFYLKSVIVAYVLGGLTVAGIAIWMSFRSSKKAVS